VIDCLSKNFGQRTQLFTLYDWRGPMCFVDTPTSLSKNVNIQNCLAFEMVYSNFSYQH